MNQAVHTYADLLIAPYQLEQITELRVSKQLNDHAKLYLCGIVSEKRSDQDVERADDNEWIDVSLKDGDRTIRLFHGVVTSMSIQARRNVRSITIEALSSTFLMDITPKTRSYQNKSMGYHQLFAAINSEYQVSDAIDNASKGKSIGDLLVQYKETDWEFMKRLASHFHAPLAPISGIKGIKYYIGVPDQPARHRLDPFNYAIKNDLKEYRMKSVNENQNLNVQDLICYEVTTNEIFELCDAVDFKNKIFYVSSAVTDFKNGVLVHSYKLIDAKGFISPKIYNHALAGTSLFGKVLDISKDRVSVHLDIDQQHDAGGAIWFPYSTIYSSPDGSGWYCMPEAGDHIRIYFPDEQENNAFAASSVNLASSDSQKRSDPSVKSISTKYGKQIVFQPGAIEIIGSGKLLMRLTDDGGIEINSDKKILLSATDDIEINGGSKIVIQGDAGIDLKQANATLNIAENVTLSGGKVNIK